MRFGGAGDLLVEFLTIWRLFRMSFPTMRFVIARGRNPPPRKWQGGASSFSFSRKMGGHSKAETKDGWLPKEEEEWGRDKVGGQRRRVWAPKKREDDVLPKRIHITCVIQEATLNFCP